MFANDITIKDDNSVYYFEYNDQPLTGTSSEFQAKHDEITGDWVHFALRQEMYTFAGHSRRAGPVPECSRGTG